MDFSFSTSITVPHALPDPNTALLEQLLQDGFFRDDLLVPTMTEADFATVLADAKNFATEVIAAGDAWPLRAERWLYRLSTITTGKVFGHLNAPQRFAMAHAALTLADHPELLR